MGGLRTDHELTNLFVARKFQDKNYNITLINKNNQCVKYLKNEQISFDGKINDNVGIFGINAVVNSNGLMYELENYKLSLGISDSSSNSMSKNKANIIIDGEGIVIYPCDSLINTLLK